MAAWPGGNCPDCGDFMPPNLITCQTCRAMLNPDLKVNVVDIPDFMPLKEISPSHLEESDTELISPTNSSTQVSLQVLLVDPKGIFYQCPGCHEELKIPQQFTQSGVQCNFCEHQFHVQMKEYPERVAAAYADCPYCDKRIRASQEMTNKNVQCMYCQGALHVKLEYT